MSHKSTKGFTPHHFYLKNRSIKALFNITIRNRKSGAGLTLIELLVYISLVVGILITATTFAWNIINSRTKAFAIQEVEQNGRFIMEKITQTTYSATDITSPTPGNSANQLELVLKDLTYDPTVFTVVNNTIQMSEGAGGFINLSSDRVRVTDLIFRNMSSANGKTKNVEVTFTLEHLNPDNRQEWQFSDNFKATIELRDR